MDFDAFPCKPVIGPEGAIAVIFSNQRSDSDSEGCQTMAQRMVEMASEQPGYLGVESVRDEIGRGITVSYWKDRASALAWKAVDEHAVAQRMGRSDWYSSYMVRIARMEGEYGPAGGQWNQTEDTVGPALWARYNAWANHRMLEATSRLHENHFDVEIGRKTVRGLWNHLIRTDLDWLQRFGWNLDRRKEDSKEKSTKAESGPSSNIQNSGSISLKQLPGENGNEASQGPATVTEEFYSFEEIQQARSRLDQDIVEFCSGQGVRTLGSPTVYNSSVDGKTRSLDSRIALFHFFNHQTFHRGQLTVVLRQLGVTSEMTDIVWMVD